MSGWRDRAACAGYATDWWHSDNAANQRKALDRCDVCSVTADCLNAADQWGIWGGQTANQRATIANETCALPACSNHFQIRRPQQRYCSRQCAGLARAETKARHQRAKQQQKKLSTQFSTT